MTCPECHKPIIAIEIDQIEADICINCGGTWLDRGELDLLLEGATNSRMAQMTPATETDEKPKRDCPICDARMQLVVCAGENTPKSDAVVVDKCPNNDGLWFDKGELKRILEMGDFPIDHRIYEVLDHFFHDV
jgi:Zn-finger nucleic acid-binding protein